VSGRTTSSVELPVEDCDDDEVRNGSGVADVSAAARLANSWWRSLTGSAGVGDDSGRRRMCDSNGAGSNPGGNDGGGGGGPKSSAPLAASCAGARGQRPANVPPAAIALGDWTVISNSSLKDVNGDDLRDELVGYYDDAADASPSVATAATATVTVAGEYF